MLLALGLLAMLKSLLLGKNFVVRAEYASIDLGEMADSGLVAEGSLEPATQGARKMMAGH
jgi:hypothetical protein